MNAEDLLPSAIFAETGPRIRAQSAAITLRIWHHLASEEARVLLFEPFRVEGRPLPLIEAILFAAHDGEASFAMHLDTRQIRAGQPPLGDAFTAALADIFGEASRAQIVPAWRGVLDRLLDRIAARIERRLA